jgi:hypothetical protein
MMVNDAVIGVHLGSKTLNVIGHTSTEIAKGFIPFLSTGLLIRWSSKYGELGCGNPAASI